MTFREPQVRASVGGCNVRDLGGHGTVDGRRVRRGLIFRSGVLSYLTPADHEDLAQANIRTIVDLRRDDEIASEPTLWPTSVNTLNWQLEESLASSQRGAPWEKSASGAEAREWMIDSYTGMAKWLARPLQGIFEAIIADDIPLLFHCAAGKDRTGFCASIILATLGVSDETILQDYAYTDTAVNLYHFTTTHRAGGMGLTDQANPFERMEPEVRAALMRADPAYLSSALGAVRADHGSVEAYVRQTLGIDDRGIATIRERLLEDFA